MNKRGTSWLSPSLGPGKDCIIILDSDDALPEETSLPTQALGGSDEEAASESEKDTFIKKDEFENETISFTHKTLSNSMITISDSEEEKEDSIVNQSESRNISEKNSSTDTITHNNSPSIHASDKESIECCNKWFGTSCK
ncbi:hypothetical protein DSO57_1016266 [Entomophthora muscae]|uniref:Uncharacterized protein n=1 Tax=Entomophthora muscae TaxID=34485 RepID=A0ACC2TSC8_9FUNG|nr:hypothetical protein DSO57_1016266 [Entomophthora muscae]